MGKPLASSPNGSKFRANVAEARRERAREEILEVARAVLLEGGLSALTMGAVAARLGVTKPAVYYYFDGREALLAAVSLGALAAEADALIAAVAAASDGLDAVVCFARTCVFHHRAHLDDFRMVYALGQLVSPTDDAAVRGQVPAITRPMYDALEARLVEAQAAGLLAPGVSPRATAVAVHLAALGFCAMYSLTEARGDPMKQAFDVLLDAWLVPLRRGLAA